MFNKVDTKTHAYSMAKYDPTIQLQGHKPLFAGEEVAEYNVTHLNNGFTVLTESQTFPGAVHMGKLNKSAIPSEWNGIKKCYVADGVLYLN